MTPSAASAYGISVGFHFFWFTRMWVFKHLGAANVGIGVADIILSATLGRASDKVGRTPCLGVATWSALTAHSTIFDRLQFTDADSVQFVEIGVVAGLLGVGNAGFTTSNHSYLSGLLPNDSAVVFSVYRTTQFVFTAIAMLTINTWPESVVLCVVAALVVVAWMGFGVGGRAAAVTNGSAPQGEGVRPQMDEE